MQQHWACETFIIFSFVNDSHFWLLWLEKQSPKLLSEKINIAHYFLFNLIIHTYTPYPVISPSKWLMLYRIQFSPVTNMPWARNLNFVTKFLVVKKLLKKKMTGGFLLPSQNIPFLLLMKGGVHKHRNPPGKFSQTPGWHLLSSAHSSISKK